MNVIETKKAMEFLRGEYLLRKFAKEVDKSPYSKSDFEEYVERVEGYDLINAAFDWGESVDGHTYWSRIHTRWLDFRRINN